MKLLILFLSAVLINLAIATDFVTIIPYGKNQCGDVPTGQGYHVPLETCINLYFQDTLFKVIGDQLFVTIGSNCTDPTPQIYIYNLNECQDFKLSNSRYHYSSIISINTTPPVNSLSYNYYYNSKSCSGEYYSIFHTDGSTQDYFKYLCDNGEPTIYDCLQFNTENDCKQLNISTVCNTSSKYPSIISC